MDIRSPPAPTAEHWRRSTVSYQHDTVHDKLPGPARRKLEALRTAEHDAKALSDSVYKAMRKTRDQLQAVELRIIELRRRYNYAETHPQLQAELNGKLVVAAELRQLSDEFGRRRDGWESARTLVQSCERYTQRLTAGSIELAPDVVARRGKINGETLAAIRHKVEALGRDIQSAIDAPKPSSDVKAQCRAWVEAVAAEPNVLGMIEANHQAPVFPAQPGGATNVLDATGLPSGIIYLPDRQDVLALMCWAIPETIIGKLHAGVDAVADDGSALSDAERSKLLAKHKAEKLRLEREVESLLEALAANGQHYPRRRDADPRAILNLADTLPEPAQ